MEKESPSGRGVFTSETLYRRLFEEAPDGLVFCDLASLISLVNDEFCRMFGYERDEVVGRKLDEIVALNARISEQAKVLSKEYSIAESLLTDGAKQRKDDSTFPVSITTNPVSIGGTHVGSLTVYRDISERLRHEEEVRTSEAKLRGILESHPELIMRFTPDLVMTYANKAYCDYHGISRDEVVGRSFTDNIAPEDIPLVHAKMLALTPENSVVKGEEKVAMDSGEIRWQEWTDQGIFDECGRLIEIQSVGRDITDRKRDEAELERLNREIFISATTDKITGLLNRQHFDEIMHREISISSRYGTPLSIIMIDLDNFKKINDSCGHIAGDTALAEIADIIRDNTRASDLAARWGGDEFIISCQSPSGPAEALAEKIRTLFLTLQHGGFGPVSGSFGVSSCRKGDSVESITRRADELMYKAKREGGNRVMSVQDIT